MIKTIIATNYLGETITLELARPELSGLAVRGVTGLGPSDATVTVSEMAGFDGGEYVSSRVGSRHIVLNLLYVNTFVGSQLKSIEYSRLLSYKYFPIKKKVRLVIVTDSRTVYVDGYVEKNEPDIFSPKSGSTISISCPSAFLYDVNTQVYSLSVFTPLLEFPLQIPSDQLEFSTIGFLPSGSINYVAEGEAGLLIRFYFSGEATGLVLNSIRDGTSISIDTAKLSGIVGSNPILGDELHISTVKGNKYATYKRGGTSFNVVNALGLNPSWFSLFRGENEFALEATTGLSKVECTFYYLLGYQGV